MYIESIELKDFRNYESLLLPLDKGVNILYGDNAQGKTNVLEALYVGCTSKSHRSVKDREMIRFSMEEAHIKLNLRKKDVPYRIDMHIKKNKSKGIALNGVPIRRASQLFGLANLVFFSPEDLSIIKNGPSERRRFMDMELCQLDRLYIHDLIAYNRVLMQRNKLLKELSFREDYRDMLEIYDDQLISYGEKLIRVRSGFIEKLNDIISEIHSHITGGKEQLSIRYEKNTEQDSFRKNLEKVREQELKQRISLVGPHRDDLCFQINGTDIRHFGSQGQQRTAALSLKLSEIRIVEELTGDMPVLLLDDVLSELDRSRQNLLLDSIKNIQAVITCTGLDDFINNRFHIDKIFKVQNGTVTGEN